ncbi:bactericidal permeability-increasing protein-like [Halichondria panicea]|uniref:bactericidal permeability-increasing protein-like n=1 Tax=Halichondria panicea TaxID=6063 RepID=UPI00312B8B18
MDARVLLTVLLTVCLAEDTLAVNPGFKTTITSKGLDYIRQVGIPILEQSLSSITIPDISGKAGTPIGSISYSLSSIKLSGLTIPTSTLTSVPGKGILVQASSISMTANANWHYRENSWPHVSDSGSCDVSVSSVSLTMSVLVGADSKGHATLSTTGCSLSIEKLDIHFHGGASWLYNLFASSIAGGLKGSIQQQVCAAATEAINKQGNAALESLPIVVKVDKTSEINFALLTTPTFSTTYVETDHKGEFFLIAKPVECPYTPAPLPPVTESGNMMYVWLTEYLADSAGFVYQQAGILNYNVTADMVPKSLPLQLNTSSFRLIVPALYNKYPNMAMMLGLVTVRPPNLTINSTSADFVLPGNVDVYVVNSTTKQNIPVFTLGINVLADVKVKVAPVGGKEIVSANLTFLKASINLVKSDIGQFSVFVLQTAANLLCTAFVIPTVNQYANAGIPIPIVDGISFVNPSISFGQGYVLVSTDINYKP